MNNKRCNNPPRALSLTVAVGAASIRSQGGIWFQTVVGSPVAFRARSGLPHRLRLQKKRGFILQFTISNLQCLTFSFLEEEEYDHMADGRSILERLPLGRTDLRVSPLGIGTGPWGDRLRWGYGQSYTETDLQAVFAVAVKAGINFFDSAEVYGRGHSERLLGQFIRTTGQTVVVATKFMPFPWRLRRKSLLQALQHSLDRLGRERVDLYQIHVPLPPVSIKTWMDAMAEAVDAGLIRAVGVSNCGLARMERAHRALAQRGVVLASNQVQYNLLHRAPEYNGLLRACREQGITLIAHSPLARGVLTAKYGPDNPPPGFRGYRFDRKYLTHMQPLITLLQEIGQAHGNKTPVQVALNWIIYKGAVPIPGAKNARQAEQNVGALGWRLTDDEIAALDNASEKTDQRSANEIKPRLRRNS